MSIRRRFDWRLIPSFAACVVLAAFVALAGIAATGAETTANSGTIRGVLLDAKCSPNAELRMVPSPNPHFEGGMLWAYTHTRECLLMPACQRSGYGVFTNDNDKFLVFDAAGSQKALALIQASKKLDDFRVEVTGEVQGDKIKVASLKLLP
jgi:hypothetical protein